MTESFKELFEKSIEEQDIRPGERRIGVIVDVDKDVVRMDVGLKSEGCVPIEQFKNAKGELDERVKIGGQIPVCVEAIEDGFGETVLSREKCKRQESWSELEKAYKDGQIVKGIITSKVKGGFTVEMLDGLRAFLPGSQVGVSSSPTTGNRWLNNPGEIEGQELEFKVIKIDAKRNNVVVSRREALESQSAESRAKHIEYLKKQCEEGKKSLEAGLVEGTIKNTVDYGVFVQLQPSGIDGLLHVTDIDWKRVTSAHDLFKDKIGKTEKFKVLKVVEEEKGDGVCVKVSLGLKQKCEDPWSNILNRYKVGQEIKGKITNITDYGCFVEIDSDTNIEGLVHVSEMDWTQKTPNPHNVEGVKIGNEINVQILDIIPEKRRISLGMKQCKSNPWELFEQKYSVGDVIEGKIKSITDFGLFIGLPYDIDGLVHHSDIRWDASAHEAIKDYKKGDTVKVKVLQTDATRQRISLGIKQLHSAEDPFDKFANEHREGSSVSGRVVSISDKGAKVELDTQVSGIINPRQVPLGAKLSDIVKINDTVQAKILKIDRKNRVFELSLKQDDPNPSKSKTEKEDTSTTLLAEAFKIAKGG